MLVEGGDKYKVKLINSNGSKEETIKEIVGALDHLNSISCEIFSTIRCRLEDQRGQVGSLTQRLVTASEKVESIKGSQKAIRIISPAKYPADLDTVKKQGNTDISLKALVSKKIASFPREMNSFERSLPFRFDPPIKHPDDLLACFHAKETQLVHLNQLGGMVETGVGRPPSGMSTVDSFLLFNTAENPYQHYRIVGKTQLGRQLSGQRPIRRGEEVHVETDKTQQPTSLQNEQKAETDDFYYYPSTLQIPDIDVPDRLPDLPGTRALQETLEKKPLQAKVPGIVDNLDFSPVESQPPYFSFPQPRPSTLSMSSSFSSGGGSSFFGTPTPTTLTFLQSQTPSTVEIKKVEKPLILEAQDTSKSTPQNPGNTARNVIASIPPPPPPPPPIEPTAHKRESSPPKKQASASGGEDMRSSLMAAIRNAGGAGRASLRSAKDMKYEQKRKKQEEKEKLEKTTNAETTSGGNLMDDLKHSLAMRRKGISGNQTKPVSGVGDIMQKLVATIPLDDSRDSPGFGDDDESENDDWD